MSRDRQEEKGLVNGDATEGEVPRDTLSQQYGGGHAGGWVNLLPASWVPYVQLARLSPPAALFLIYFPHAFGALHAARAHSLPAAATVRACAQLLGGSFFFSNAAHAWNDLIDAPIDRQVARTRGRPIARGDVSPRAAFAFAASQAVGAAAFLLVLPPAAAVAAVPTIVGTTYYPWAKRHIHFPQLVLGFCLAWGVVVGAAAAAAERPWADVAALCLVAACILWTTIYDTIYAYQDVADDVKIGVKSTAVLFGAHVKYFLWFPLLLLGICLVLYGQLVQAGALYYVVTVGGSVSSLGAMIANVKLKDDASCWWWFSCGFWFTGISITVGLLAGYLGL
ncbi:prenyltransferase [Durotheca rogersii]|uniref:prenyltransferase n=1 Tax=Durotheca rogersii TaxID=419775 RepID=UPI0022208183|nr:prenyltransferase [Durotheca rogersii]KAI5862346.1 prenyltransferase [Durotheca rogersii]